MAGKAAYQIDSHLFTGTSHPFRVEWFSDEGKTKKSIAGATIKATVLHGGVTKTYTVTATTAIGGVTFAGYFSLTGACYTAPGDIEIQTRKNGVTKREFIGTLRQKN